MPILTFTDSQQFTVMEAPTPPPLPSPPYFIGQGLAEPCAPYPSEQVFGALLGTPQTAISQWPSNCEPVITTPTTAFDVSAIGPGHEVVVALYVIQGAGLRTGTTVTWDWYRDRDGALLFSLPLTIAAPPSGYWWAWG